MINKIVSMIEKIAAKLLAIAISPVGLGIIGVLALMYVGGPLTASFASGNLGDWDISSYSNGEITIPIDIDVPYQGTVGAAIVSNEGASAITSQEDCEGIGWTWLTDDHANPYNCRLTNENWIIDKTYTSSITCTHSNTWRTFGEGASAYRAQDPNLASFSYSPTFDGLNIKFGQLNRQADDKVHCSGTLTVKVPSAIPAATETEAEAEAAAGLETVTISETETTKTVAYDCISNMQCTTVCGTATPTCTEGKCYCDSKVKTDVVKKTTGDEYPNITDGSTKLPFFTRLKLFFGEISFKFSNWIRGLF